MIESQHLDGMTSSSTSTSEKPPQKVIDGNSLMFSVSPKDTNLDSEYLSELLHIKNFLKLKKTLLDNFDRTLPSYQERKQKVIDFQGEVFNVINYHYIKLEKIFDKFSEKEFEYHKKHYQSQIAPLLCDSKLNKRIIEKPLGYAGDFIIMKHYYNNDFTEDSTFNLLTKRYTLELPVAKANINRKKYFLTKLKNLPNKFQDSPRIASFGCGPAVEIIELLKNNPQIKNLHITFIDSEEKALEHVRQALKEISNVNLEEIKFVKMDLKKILKASNTFISDQFDFVYSGGLIDYFKKNAAKRLLRCAFDILKPGGELIFVNVNISHQAKAYMEILGDWHLNYRTPEDMLELGNGLNYTSKKVDFDPENGENLYLSLTK